MSVTFWIFEKKKKISNSNSFFAVSALVIFLCISFDGIMNILLTILIVFKFGGFRKKVLFTFTNKTFQLFQ